MMLRVMEDPVKKKKKKKKAHLFNTSDSVVYELVCVRMVWDSRATAGDGSLEGDERSELETDSTDVVDWVLVLCPRLPCEPGREANFDAESDTDLCRFPVGFDEGLLRRSRSADFVTVTVDDAADCRVGCLLPR
mmetsp:Transcript_14294/g.57645  ORF Transcript_14294/g.57645 Transcript_14294/m.57645 type:complete len:134 (-) Transcript_14294:1158-1559(-)